jgi:hypothetical protein
MANPRQLGNLISNLSLGAAIATLAIAFLLIVGASQSSQAQTYNVIHSFTGGQDGATPEAAVYKLTPGRLLEPLFTFDFSDGANPKDRVIFGPDGTLSGATEPSGNSTSNRPPMGNCIPFSCVSRLRP